MLYKQIPKYPIESNYTEGATVIKLPDTKPLKLVGCFSPLATK